ncbi:MAG: alpha/beta hydrolase [Phycisphaerales bacterium]
MMMFDWTIPGAVAQPIIGTTHVPDCDVCGHVVIAHGFKGYKDYGMFPCLAHQFAAHGFVAHRFNFSHSGMTNEVATFARPDLFKRDTWNHQVHDLRAVTSAVREGTLPGGHNSGPIVLFGHSRGGVTVLLTVGRAAADESFPQPTGVITAAAPASTCSLDEEQKQALRQNGFLQSPSSRTGQTLRIGREWLEEQEADPQSHDLLNLIPNIDVPLLIVHGEDDPTVDPASARIIADAATSAEAHVVMIRGANHVFNTPNPFPADQILGGGLAALVDAAVSFARQCVGVA